MIVIRRFWFWHRASRQLLAERCDNIPGFVENFAFASQQVTAALDQLTLQSYHAAAYRFESLKQRAENRLFEIPRSERFRFVLEEKLTVTFFYIISFF